MPTESAPVAQPAQRDLPGPRSTVPETWRWVWRDIAFRLAPFALATAFYARFWGGSAAGVGLTAAYLPRDLLLGTLLGVPLAALAAWFRRLVAPGYRLPTPADQALETAFYFVLNAPIEELFWRGTVQTLAIAGVTALLGRGALAAGIGFALATAVFGAYHRLGKWSWRSIAGVTFAGAVFGLSYLLQPAPRSILLPSVIHGFATAGFLSWGDVALHRWHRHGARRRN
ncbi:MAG TPA: CPBP family intramembrane glutamic endopeptidase [Ktedonobacterales bacterium]|nr:CPBP family intramembrane glutamic endopeptidase [Ktedonobacterales bacterium]